MNKRFGPVFVLLLICSLLIFAGATVAQETLFSTGFEFDVEPYGLLESGDLNGARDQVGLWSGDDFPEADATGFFAGGVLGGDSAGFADNPHGGRLLLVDRPLENALHFMNLTRQVPRTGVRFSFDVGTTRNGVGGAADYDFFGLDQNGSESFRIRIGADTGTQRLGYVAGGDVVFDLPTLVGEDRANDVANSGLPPFSTAADIASVSVKLLESGYTINYKSLNSGDRYATSPLPYNGRANSLSRVGLSYRGVEGEVDQQAGFFVDNLRVALGEPALIGYVNPYGKVVVGGEGQNVFGIDLSSPEGLLVPVPPGRDNATPFEFLLANDEHRITYGNLGKGLILDGEVVLRAGYSGTDPASELVAIWGNEEAKEFQFTVANPESKPEFRGFINPLGKIVVEGIGQEVVGLDFGSPAGLLVPQSTSSVLPFQFLLSNTPERATFGNLASAVTIDGQLVLQIGYSGDDPENELIASWGDTAAVAHPFIVSGQDPSLRCPSKSTLDEAGLLAGDFNTDGLVNFADFLSVSVNFGMEAESYSDGDVDCNGRIEFRDFLVVSENFMKPGAALASVSEPDGLPLFGLLIGFAVGGWRHRSNQV